MVFDIEQVVLQLLSRVFDRGAVGIFDLRPTGQSGWNQVALFVIRDLLGQLCDEVRPLWSWPNEIHFTFQNVPELRNLVDTDLANHATNARCAIVVLRRPHRSRFLSVDSHRATLCQNKRPAVFADAFLLVKDWTTRLELDQNRREDNDGQRDRKSTR